MSQRFCINHLGHSHGMRWAVWINIYNKFNRSFSNEWRIIVHLFIYLFMYRNEVKEEAGQRYRACWGVAIRILRAKPSVRYERGRWRKHPRQPRRLTGPRGMTQHATWRHLGRACVRPIICGCGDRLAVGHGAHSPAPRSTCAIATPPPWTVWIIQAFPIYVYTPSPIAFWVGK